MMDTNVVKSDLIEGLKAYPRAVRFITKNKLWRYFLIPALIGLLMFALVFGTVYEFVPDIVYFLSDYIGYDDWNFWGSAFLEKMFNFLLGLVMVSAVVLVFFVSFKFVIQIVLSPFLAWISEKTENIITGNEYPFDWGQFLHDSWRGVKMTVRNLIREVPLSLLILAFGLIPVVGVVAPILLFVVSAYFVGFGMIDFYHERRQLSIPQSVQIMRKHRTLAVAVGAGFNLILMIPIVGVLIGPMLSAVAGTLAAIEREKGEFKIADSKLQIQNLKHSMRSS